MGWNMIRTLRLLTLLLVCPVSVWATAYTSTQAGDFNSATTWGGGGYPVDGDTAIIATGHAITATTPVTVGTSGATGTTAVTLQGTGSLSISSSFNCRGNLLQQRGSTVTGLPGGSLVLDAPAGSQYKWVTNTTGTGAANAVISGTSWTAGSFFTVDGNGGRGGSNGFIDFSDTNSALYTAVNFNYAKLQNLGSASVKAFYHYVQTTGSISTLNHVIFSNVGRVDIDAAQGGADWNYVDIRTPLNTSFVGVWNGGGAAPTYTRSYQNITVYNPSTTIMPLQINGRLTKLENITTYNADITLAANTRNTVANKIFQMHDRTSGSSSISVYTNSKNTVQNSIFLKHTTNQHIFSEIVGANADGVNEFNSNISDGDNYFSLDTGDVVICSAPVSAKYNLMINGVGVGSIPQTSAATIIFDNNTMFNSWGQALGEASGWATSHVSTRNNIFASQGEGVHQLSVFVPQSGWTLDYNVGWDNTVASTPNYSYASGAYVPNVTHPTAGVVSYLGKARYGAWFTSGSYGDDGKGAHDLFVNPGFIDSSRTVRGYGSWADVQTAAREMVSVNGVAYDGSTTTATTKTIDSALAWIRYGFTPTNPALRGTGYGGVDIGAMDVVTLGDPAALLMVQ